MSENKQDKKQSQDTNPTIQQASKVMNYSVRQRMKSAKPGAVESEGFNDVNDATMTTAW